MNHGLLGYRLTGQQTTPQPGIDLQGKSTAAEIKRDNTHLRTRYTDLIVLKMVATSELRVLPAADLTWEASVKKLAVLFESCSDRQNLNQL
jgi:hypothetical protein